MGNNDKPLGMSGGVPAGELLPCPFCGSEAEIERIGNHRQSTIYQCTSCSCSLETGEEWDHGRRWNTRATPTPPIEGRDADVERVSKAIYDAVEPLSGDPIAVVLHNSDHLFWDDRLPGDTDVERQLAAVRIICDTAARAALQALGERG